MTKTYIGHNEQWELPLSYFGSTNGGWTPAKMRYVGFNGKWVESMSTEVVDTNPTFSLDSLSYRAGNQLQGGFDIKGKGFAESYVPLPRHGVNYELKSSFTDKNENFAPAMGFGEQWPPVFHALGGIRALLLDKPEKQYMTLPYGNTGAYDLLGMLGTKGNSTVDGAPGNIFWSVAHKFHINEMPVGNQRYYVLWGGTEEQHIAAYVNSSGDLVAEFVNNNYRKELRVNSRIVGNVWYGFNYRHFTEATTRYLELTLSYPNNGSYSVESQRVAGDIQYTINQTVWKTFDYWIPALDEPVVIGAGKPGNISRPVDKFFRPSVTPQQYTIAEDGLGYTTAGASAFRCAWPSGYMEPNTGKYYIEVAINNTYDTHIGFSDGPENLNTAPGVIGWCVNTFSGRKFAKQTGAGTTWSTQFPVDSIVGILYDSDVGNFRVFVNGTERPVPFPAGTITQPVKFVIGSSAQAERPANIRVHQMPSTWTNTPSVPDLQHVPNEWVIVKGAYEFSAMSVTNLFVTPTPYNSQNEVIKAINPDLRTRVFFEDIASGNATDCTGYIIQTTEDRIAMGIPQLPPDNYLIYLENFGETRSVKKRFTIKPFDFVKTPMKIDFSTTDDWTIKTSLMVAHKGWGGLNGGVIAQNVHFNRENGTMDMYACGDLYTGEKLGVDLHGELNGINKRMGACLVTRDYFGPGSYRVLMKPLQKSGACNALWTFHYEEAYPNTPLWDDLLEDGLHPQGNPDRGFYMVRNHEIDIEFPTALKTDPDQQVVSFYNARFNTWLGDARNWDVPNNDVPTNDPNYSPINDPAYWSTYTDDFVNHGVELNDGQFHEMRFDWHVGPDARVEFYIDGVLKHTIRTHIPNIPGRFWVGHWFPSSPNNHWAGKDATFDVEKMEIKSIEIIPFTDEMQYMRSIPETYPDDVYRDFMDNPLDEVVTYDFWKLKTHSASEN